MADANTLTLYAFDNYIAMLVDGIDAGAHKHGAYQLSISLDGGVHSCGPTKGAAASAPGHLVAPNTPHCLHSESGRQALFWIAPQSTIARELGAKHLDDTGFGTLTRAAIDQRAASGLLPAHDDWPPQRVRSACDMLLNTLADSPWSDSADLHPATRAAVEIIHDEFHHPISADDIAARVGFSTSRLLHLFKEQMGTPLRPHVQWLRLVDAMVQISNGANITDSAAHAGFADGAHLSRSMKQYLGLRPSDLIDHPDMRFEVCFTHPVV